MDAQDTFFDDLDALDDLFADLAEARTRAGRPPRRGRTAPPGRGQSGREGPAPRGRGPGRWQGNLHGGTNMSPGAAAYQRQISGRSVAYDYRVQGGGVTADFDGYRRGVLLDAKAYGPRSAIVRAYQLGGIMPEALYLRAEELAALARRQIQAAGSTPIEWHVASREGAVAVRALLRAQGLLRRGRGGGILVVHTRPSPRVRRPL